MQTTLFIFLVTYLVVVEKSFVACDFPDQAHGTVERSTVVVRHAVIRNIDITIVRADETVDRTHEQGRKGYN